VERLRWLYPGLKVKRWLGLALLGMGFIFIGLVILLGPGHLAELWKHSLFILGELVGSYTAYNGVLILAAGIFLFWFGIRCAFRSIVETLIPDKDSKMLPRIVQRKRQMERGPKIVAIGGGTGLPNLLRGLKPFTDNITAVVTVSDDGGSSGKLRGEMDMLPPGDMRNCLLALAETEPLMKQIFNYRFTTRGELQGHNVGNLIIAALIDRVGYREALFSISRVLAVKGKVLPVSDKSLTLEATYTDGSQVVGESSIPIPGKTIHKIQFQESDVDPLPEVISAIGEADAIILGPGSVYTSIIPNLIVPGVVEAISMSPALKIYVSNIMTQPGETDGYKASDHLKAICRHTGHSEFIDTVVVNKGFRLDQDDEVFSKYLEEGQEPVEADMHNLEKYHVHIISKHLSRKDSFIRHDSEVLGKVLMREIWKEKSHGESK